MPVAPGNRMYTAFPMRLMFVFPAICPREVETRLFYKDKLEFIYMSRAQTIVLQDDVHPLRQQAVLQDNNGNSK